MTVRHALAGGAVFLVVAGCSSREPPSNPTSPTPASQGVPVPIVPRKIALGEVVAVDLDTTFYSGKWYCELGNDPVPCEWFVLDVPRAGTLVIRMEFDTDGPMFLEVGNLAIADHLSLVSGGSPLVATATVPAGGLPFRAGLNVPWGRNGSVSFRVVATLE